MEAQESQADRHRRGRVVACLVDNACVPSGGARIGMAEQLNNEPMTERLGSRWDGTVGDGESGPPFTWSTGYLALREPAEEASRPKVNVSQVKRQVRVLGTSARKPPS
jgi:hypothetical protein